MDFSFTDEQSMLRDTVASYLADHYDFEKRRGVVTKEPGWRPEVWKAFAEELGILGAPFSEELGGLGGGPIENMVVMEEFGKALVVEPYLGTVVIGGGFLKHSGHAGAADLIGGIIEGKTIFAFAYAEPKGRYNLAALETTAKKDGAGWTLNGHKAVVIGAPFATHLIVTARTAGGMRDASGVSVFIVEKNAKGVTTRDYPTVDGTGVRDYIHVVDLALGHLAALDAIGKVEGFRAVNLGTGTGSSVLEVIAAASKAVGHEVPYRIVERRAGDIAATWAEPALAHELLGWRATRTLDDMAADHWRWQSQNPSGYPSPE